MVAKVAHISNCSVVLYLVHWILSHLNILYNDLVKQYYAKYSDSPVIYHSYVMATRDNILSLQVLLRTDSHIFKDLCDPKYLAQSLLYLVIYLWTIICPTIWAKQKMNRIHGTVQVTNVKIYHSTQNLYVPSKLLDI